MQVSSTRVPPAARIVSRYPILAARLRVREDVMMKSGTASRRPLTISAMTAT